MSSYVTLELSVCCEKCNAPLEVDCSTDRDGAMVISVSQCEDCVLDRTNEAHDEGYDEGYEAGYKEAKEECDV